MERNNMQFSSDEQATCLSATVVFSGLCFAHDYLLNNEKEIENKK
jgi:hypothetical protein